MVTWHPNEAKWSGKEGEMSFDTIVAVLTAAIIFIGPLAVLAIASLRFGVDSRPGIDDRDRRPWLVPTARA
jgi:hypothetical protein